MIRHIENAINYCQGKKRIIAFYIIEKNWRHKEECTRKYFKESLEKETIKKNAKLEKMIYNCFYGYKTWQEIAKELKINFPM